MLNVPDTKLAGSRDRLLDPCVVHAALLGSSDAARKQEQVRRSFENVARALRTVLTPMGTPRF